VGQEGQICDGRRPRKEIRKRKDLFEKKLEPTRKPDRRVSSSYKHHPCASHGVGPLEKNLGFMIWRIVMIQKLYLRIQLVRELVGVMIYCQA